MRHKGIWHKAEVGEKVETDNNLSPKNQEIRALRHFAVVHENEPVPSILTQRRKDAINARNFASLRLRVKYQGVVQFTP